MTATSNYGEISAFSAYSLDRIGAIFNHDREWAKDTFIRPIDRNTKQRRIDKKTGEPLCGVAHFKVGWETIVTGEALLRWLSEHGDNVSD
jgi:hypothetical protein